MTDLDVLKRFHNIVGIGTLNTNTSGRLKHAHHKISYSWSVQNYEDLKWFGNLILPWLGERRRAKFKEVIKNAVNGHTTSKKLNQFEVKEMRKLYSTGRYSQKDLGIMFGVSSGHVSRIITHSRRGIVNDSY